MALRAPWDRYETALLIETYMLIKNNLMTRDEGVSRLSSRLRNYAIISGKEIDEIYRNKNGISLRLHELGYLFGDEGGIRNTSYLFQGMVDMYKNENKKYQEILEEAKQNIPDTQGNSTDEVINEEPQAGNTYPTFRKKEPVVKEGFGSKLMRYFRSIVPKNENEKEKNNIDNEAVISFLDYLDRSEIEYVDKSKTENRIWIIDRPEYLKTLKALKRIGLNMHFNYNVGRIKTNCTAWWVDCNEITSDILKELTISKPIKKDDLVKPTIYVSLPPKINVIEKLEPTRHNDDLVKFLEQNHIEYIDMRNKKGCLWIFDSPLVIMLVIGLTDEKILFHYSPDGGKACNYKSAWWTKSSGIALDEKTIARLVGILNKNKNNTLLLKNEQNISSIEFINKHLTNSGADALIEYLKNYGVNFVDARENLDRICLIEDAASKIIVKRLKEAGLVFHYRYSLGAGKSFDSKSQWWIEVEHLDIKDKKVHIEKEEKASSVPIVKLDKEASPISVGKITETKIVKISAEELKEESVKLEQPVTITKETNIDVTLASDEIDALIIRLINNNVQFLDDREKEGRFWIFDGPRTAPFIAELRDKGVSLHYKYIVGLGTKHKGSWWMEAEWKPVQVETNSTNSFVAKSDVADTGLNDSYKDKEKMFFDFLNTTDIKYVDSSNIDRFIWFVDGVETFKMIKRMKKQDIKCALKLDGGKNVNHACAWRVLAEDLFADDINIRAIVSESDSEIIYSPKAEVVSSIEKKNDANEQEKVKETEKLDLDREVLLDEETIADRIYCFLYNSVQTYPKGLTIGYVASKLQLPAEQVKEVLVRVDWVEKNDLRFVLNDKIKGKQQRLKFHMSTSLAFTRPMSLRYYKNEEIEVSSWREVLIELTRMLYKEYKQVFEKLSIRNEVDKVVDGRHKHYLNVPGCIGDNLWIELARTPEDIVNYIKVILKRCDVLTSNIEIFYVRKEIEVPVKEKLQPPVEVNTNSIDEREKGEEGNSLATTEIVEESPQEEVVMKEVLFDLSKVPNLENATLVRATYRSIEVFTVDSWRRLLINLSLLLYYDFHRKLSIMAMRNDPDKIVDGRHKINFTKPFNIGGNLWIETERSTESIIDFIRFLLTGCGLSLESVQIVCRVVDKPAEVVEVTNIETSENVSMAKAANSYKDISEEQSDTSQNTELESTEEKTLDYQEGEETYKGSLVEEDIRHSVDFDSLGSYAYTSPVQFNYFGEVCESVSSWRQVLIRIITLLYEDYPDILKELAEDEKCKTIYSGANEKLLRVSRKISDDLFIEVNLSAKDIVSFIKMLLVKCYVDFNNVNIIYIDNTSSKINVDENLSKESANDAVTAKSDVDNELSRYEEILREKFPRGLHINSFLDIKKFARFYNEAYKIELNTRNEAVKEDISNKLAAVGIVHGEKVFSIDNLLSDEGKKKLFNYIEEQFSKGVQALAYSAVYTQLSEDLLEEKINDEKMLQTYLRYECKGQYYFDSLYLYKDRNTNIDIDEEIVDLMHSKGIAMSVDDVARILYYLPKDRIDAAFRAKEFIRNAKGEYFHISMIDLTSKEIDAISKIIQDEIDANLFASGIDLISIIRKRKPELLERFNQFTDLGLRNAIGYLLDNKFSFVGNVISSLDKPVAMKDVFSNFGKTHEDFTLAELRQFRIDLNTIIYFDNLYENAVRISHDQFVNKKHVLFDVKNTDKAISVLCKNDYISLNDITLFSSFPYCRYAWNAYLLECYVANYSDEYKLLHTGFNEEKIVGVIVKKSSSYDTLDDVFIDVLARSGIELTVDNALQYLYDQGYLARRLLSNIEQIIINAKAKKG